MDLFVSIGLSVAAALLVMSGAVYAFQRGWLHSVIADYAEIAQLKERIEHLEIVLESVKAERNTLLGDLVNANRRNSVLEARLEEVEKKLRSREKIKILAIWPAALDLDQKGERNAIYNAGFEYRPLRGVHASKAHILRELRKDQYSILEIGAHGSEEGSITLHDGEVLPGWWQRILADRNIGIAMLLTCYSDALSDAILRAGAHYVIATTDEIEDQAAVAFAKEFYSNYADGADVETAVNNARLVLSLEQAEMIVLREGDTHHPSP